jgi:hypothetical protein
VVLGRGEWLGGVHPSDLEGPSEVVRDRIAAIPIV